MIVAFAYADTHKTLVPLYRGCAEGLVENVKTIMPGATVLHIADDDTKAIKGANVLRVPRKVGLMSWRLIAHHMAHALEDEILFAEPDARFKFDVRDELRDLGADVTLTDRECDVAWGVTTMKEIAPYGFGVSYSRCPDFWKDAAKHCLKLSEREQTWIGDMLGVKAVFDEGKYNAKITSGRVYCHSPCSENDECDVRVLHYKGARKSWLFPIAAEAA